MISNEKYAPEKIDVMAKAEGRWSYVFHQLAAELAPFQDRPGISGPCPVHGGTDGFRIFKKTASSASGGFCQTCGPKADGLALVMWVRQWSFHEALREVGALLDVKDRYGRVGDGTHDRVVPTPVAAVPVAQPTNEWLREAMRKLWKASLPLTAPEAEPARLYLRSRGILAWDRPELSRWVRYHPELTYRDSKGKRTKHPGIICALVDPEGRAVTINRHYLTPKGEKAALDEPKKMFPIPNDMHLPGCAVPTSIAGEVLDVCEGLETALSVETALGIPVWPLVNSYLMTQFTPPPSVKAVRIWADKDRKNGGQEAAIALKKRLWEMGVKAQILLPDLPITEGAKSVDWNDVLLARGRFGFFNREACRLQR